ncbi:hypothetical protein [Mycolicibacterium parafortuitum]|uniref:Uncharacterized protein n=1 Tax=Mycolicibacterium parafortuitum TaxID=39692 RepID=A0A375YHZ9_MYCPF|nr:hypothetical protein [Mycolicibacterium parafortuitum]SRX80730.1 hypothetical protein MPP7335_02474 [Mycolicibacterium parafortuitum]
MNSNQMFTGVAGKWLTLRASVQVHPAHPIPAAAAPRKRRAAAGAIAASVRGYL